MFGNIGAQFLLVVWIPVVLALFMALPARRAMVVASIAGWLLLPPTGIGLPGVPDYTKTGAVVLSTLLATIVFEPNRLFTFRPRWFDLPILVYSVCPFFSAISNDMGPYEGLSGMSGNFLEWLVPYWLGRVYLTDVDSFRELGLGIIIGGVCLIPFCLFEIRFAPIIQPILFGIGKVEGLRYGSFRPRLFFNTSLELGLWMNAATLVAWWFWRTGQFKRVWEVPSSAILAALLVIAILCKCAGATLLVTTGFGALWICLRTKRKWAMWCLLCVAPLFFAVRTTNLWSGESAVELARLLVGETRADSLDYRFENDDFLIAKALQQPIYGWGGWNRSRVIDETGRDLAETDGYWVIIFGTNGFVGLISVTLAMLLPAGLFLARFPSERWKQPGLAPVVVIATIVNLFLLDCLVNAMPNVLYVIAAGGLFNIVPSRIRSQTSDHGDDSHARVARTEQTLAAQYRARGRASKDQGRLAEAKTAWLHALDLHTKLTAADPGRPALHQQWCDCANDLAWLLVNAADPAVKDPALALSLAVRTTEMDPECSTYWNTLGASYYCTGDFKAAAAALDRSMLLSNGGTAFDRVFLTMTHAQLGNQEQAHRWFAEAMRSMEQHHPDHPELRRLCAQAKSLLSVIPELSDTVG
jgi:tetratricopeptide (TPR) repeat protein